MRIALFGDLLHYNLSFVHALAGMVYYGTLGLALGTFCTFYLLGIRDFLIDIYRLLVLLEVLSTD